MAKIVWDQVGQRFYETGVKKCVIYPQAPNGLYPRGVAWNGITEVSEKPSGAESNPFYADDIKYGNIRSAEEFGATIQAYMYPDEFAECDGTAELVAGSGIRVRQQHRKAFGLSYVTTIGNDISDAAGYKIHLIYGATVSPSERSYTTINESPEAINFSWEMSTDPIIMDVDNDGTVDFRPTSSLEIDVTKIPSNKASFIPALETVLYGTDGTVTYSEFSGSTFVSGTTYYEKNTTTNVYFVTTDTSPQTGKTYYTKSTSGGTTARLPLPDEIAAMYAAATAS